MERYPVYRGDSHCCYVRTLPDFLEVTGPQGERHYFWLGGEGVEYSGPLTRLYWEEPHTPPPWPRVTLEERVRLVAERHGDRLRGRRVMADFSGGKDSAASLAILSRLSEELGFKLTAVYVHMPYLEPSRNLDVAEREAEKLGVDLLVVEADRKRVLYYLSREGLPRRGRRWCTYLKTRALRGAKKKLAPDYEAKAERMVEAGKRMKRLSEMLRKDTFLEGPTINVVYDLELTDVAAIAGRAGLVHPDYLDGVPRVSCKYCPYRSLYELEAQRSEVEDEALVEEVAYRQWRLYYSARVSWEEYWSRHLWRFPPTLAAIIAGAEPTGRERVSLEEARELFSSIWRNPRFYGASKP